MNSWEARHGSKPMPHGVKRKMVYAGQYYLPTRIIEELANRQGDAEVQELIAAIDAFGEWR